MKRTTACILLALIGKIVLGQSYTSITIEFANHLQFSNTEDSAKYADFLSTIDEALLGIIALPQKEILYLNKDSVLVESFLYEDQPSNIIEIRTKGSNRMLDLSSGTMMKWNHAFTIAKYRKFRNYRRGPEKDESILGHSCKAWVANSKHGTHTIWVSDISLKHTKLDAPYILADGNLVLKRVLSNNNRGRMEIHKAVSVKTEMNQDLGQIFEEHLVVDIKDKYLPIPDNELLDNKPVKEGSNVNDYSFRKVYGEGLFSLHEITSKKDYTALEFWGTWCAPCLIANAKIQELKKLYGDSKLSIVSINAHDRNIDKLKRVIEKKEMDWVHGYATKKTLEVFNKKGVYPRFVLLNNKNQVLFIGHPVTDFEKIRSIIEK